MSANKPIDVDENGEPRQKYVCKKCLGDKVKSKGTGTGMLKIFAIDNGFQKRLSANSVSDLLLLEAMLVEKYQQTNR